MNLRLEIYCVPTVFTCPCPAAPVTAAPSYSLLPPAPTPYSLFQSVPENFQETDVFHLSQNVDFGKKLGVGHSSAPARPPAPPPPLSYNEVDTGKWSEGG